MENTKSRIKNYLLIKYAKKEMERRKKHLSKSLSWIQKKHLFNTIKTHCSVLLDSLINEDYNLSFREKKFIVDKIMKYSFERGSTILQANGQIKTIKPYLQLNSFIMFEEFINGIYEKKSKRAISFNMKKEFTKIQEQIDSKVSIEKILEEKISA